jgi:cobalt/nickel transport protein
MAWDIKGNLKRNKGLWLFVLVALAVTVILGVFVSPFASKSPDGLDKTAEDKGFVKKAEETKPAWDKSPMKDYAIPGVKNEKASTGLSGLIGVLITLAVALTIGLLVYGLGRLWGKRGDPGAGTSISET